MTTLPQTSQPRLPRPPGAPAPAHGIGAAVAAAERAMTASDIYRLLRANALLIIGSLIGALVLGVVANVVLAYKFSRFTAVGAVQVEPAVAYDPMSRTSVPLADFSTLAIEQRTNALMLQSEAMFAKELDKKDSPLRDTDWFRTFITRQVSSDGTVHDVADIIAARKSLLNSFSAAPIPETKLISVSMTCASPKDAAKIVETIVDVTINYQQGLIDEHTARRSQSLEQIKDRRQQEIDRLQLTQRGNIDRLGIDAGGIAGRFSSRDEQLAKLLETEVEKTTEYAQDMQQFNEISDQLHKGNNPPVVESDVSHDSDVLLYKQKLDDLDIELAAQIALQPGSIQVRELKARRDATAAKLEQIREEARVTYANALVSALQSQAAGVKQEIDQIKQQEEDLRKSLQDLSLAMQSYLTDEEQITRLNTDLKEVQDQIDLVNAQSLQGSNTISWDQRPEIPDEPSFPKLWITLSAAALLGLGTSLGITFARELMDTTIRSPRDITRVGHLTVLGMIPHEDDDPQSAGSPLPTVIFQAPASIIAEQFRQLRTRLQHSASLDSTRSLMVTSPGPGDGKTAIACNIAAGLALNGRRILLVDANFRRPELQNIFGIDGSTGLSTVLGAMENFDSAVRHTQVPNLDVLPTGPRPNNPTELLESQLLGDFIDRALEEYDHVIFDTGPLLLVSETAALAPRVDGVITVVRACASQRGLLERMNDTLHHLKAQHLGVVLNAVRAQGGGYYGRNIRTYYEYQADRVN